MTEHPPTPARGAPSRWLVLLGVGALAVSAALTEAALVSYSLSVEVLPFVVLAAAFVMAELLIFHIEVRKQTFSMSLSEFPLILGILWLGALPTVAARLVGYSIAAAVRRYPVQKSVFNLCVITLETMVLVTVVALLGTGRTVDWQTHLAVVLGMGLALLSSFCLVIAAIGLTQGWLAPRRLAAIGTPMVAVGVVNAAAAVLIALIVDTDPAGTVLLAALGLVFVLGFRVYGRSVQEHKTLDQVYGFAKEVEQSTTLAAGDHLIVEAVREEINAERAALWVGGTTDVPQRIAYADALGQAMDYPGPEDAEDPLRERVLRAGTGLLFGSRTGSEVERAALATRQAVEVIGVPLLSAQGTIGYLEVCDRRGDKLSFGDADVRMLESLATHVSAAAQNAQLLRKLRFDALHDRLTGLPNRVSLGEVITEQLAAAGAGQVAVIAVDLGTLSEVNDTLGHDAGDQLLDAVADLLRESVPPEATVGRMGGDEFAVVLPAADLDTAEVVAGRLRAALAVPRKVAGVTIEINPTLGLCVGPLHGGDAASLLQRADVALYAGHASGAAVTTYQPAMDQNSLRRLHLGTQLREAMVGGQIFAVFQPLCHLATSSIRSAETLVRWNHPRYGVVSPDDFIPLAERIGMIDPLTEHVLALALRKCRAWLDADLRIAVAVNLSVRTLSNSDFPATVERALSEFGVPPALLTFEITESSVMSDPQRAMPILQALHGLGLRLAIDDFGTGHSSLAYLSQLPVDEVKIDKAFIRNIATEMRDASITHAIIDLAHRLGLEVVAEGVEDELTRDLLARMGCDVIQGYLITRPLPAARLDRWMQARTVIPSGARRDSGYPTLLPSLD